MNEIKIDEIKITNLNLTVCGARIRKGRFVFNIGRPILKTEGGEKIMLELNCTNEEKIHVSVHPVTLAGNPVTLDGPVAITVQSGDGAVEVDPEGMGFSLISGSTPGDTAYLISADADLGEGVENIAEVIVLHVAGAKATNLGLTAEVPVLK